MMSDLPFGAVKVQVENGYANFIGANGEVLGTRVMGQPRIWRCTACGCRCEAGSLIRPSKSDVIRCLIADASKKFLSADYAIEKNEPTAEHAATMRAQ